MRIFTTEAPSGQNISRVKTHIKESYKFFYGTNKMAKKYINKIKIIVNEFAFCVFLAVFFVAEMLKKSNIYVDLRIYEA